MLRLPAHLSAHIGVAPTGWIFIKFDAGDFYESLPRNSKIRLKSDNNIRTLHQEPSMFIPLTAIQNIFVARQQCNSNPLLHFHGNNGNTNMSQCYITGTLPVTFAISFSLTST